ncbi:MAG: flagellar hook-associated protein FlgK [Fimbriimonadaceae bacterium]
MPSPFLGIDLASRALRAFQRQLDVTGQNIANVNTPGYSRQVAEVAQLEGTTMLGIAGRYSLGNGVTIGSVNRIRDQFLEMRRMGEASGMGRFSTLADGLSGVQAIYTEPGDSGISNALDKFFNAWSSFASNPAAPGARDMVQVAGASLTQRVRSVYAGLTQTEVQFTSEIGMTLRTVDDLTSKISQLNSDIRQRTASGDLPNDLMDMRDQAIQQLAGIIDIKTYNGTDGTISVYMNQLTLVDSTGSNPIPKTFDAATGTLTDGTLTYDVRSGKLKGLFDTLNNIASQKGQLDTLANSMRTSINGIHATGMNPNGTTGMNFFNDGLPQTGAIDFDLDAAVKADANNISSGVSGEAGDGGLALSLSRLRDDTTVVGLAGRSITQYYADLVSGVGQDIAFYEGQRDTQAAVIEQIDLQRQSISGVSLDDEMAYMMRFQRSYQAAAKALTVFDQVTEDLINMLRR